MATRRKRSRGGRSGARAGGPPTSNALEWAERLATGEEAPQPSALEWAESLAKGSTEQEPTPSSPWPTASTKAGSATAAATPFGRTGPEPGSSLEAGATGAAPPFGAAPPAGPGGDGAGDDGAPGWGPVAATEPPARRSRRRGGGTGADAQPSRKPSGTPGRAGRRSNAATQQREAGDTALTPPGTTPDTKDQTAPTGTGSPFPAIAEPPARGRSRRSAPAEDHPADNRTTDRPSDKPEGPAGAGRSKRGRPAGRRPAGRTAAAGPAEPSGKRLRRILAKGLPRAADKPTVLIIAAVVAVVLGLGVGWTTNYFDSGQNLAAASPQQCAAAQTAWAKAANAQTGISEDEPASVRSGFIEARDAMESIDVPEAIAKDWGAAHTFYATIADALEAEEAGDAEGIAEAAQIASTKVNTDDMIATSKRITRYVNADCNA
ncbi:hypothetical protein [Myceligenerans indicum]|uniref:Uncharacterized protein n=1 Tax=Myceligenerans indicum TaxID=2593663 RepID=A0ABS1LLQ5_9MICO|nr:hypothetical protein [Myceligenerans indicum]MBL0887190.1 hypothetical protein [Myceligenerans indicum]